MKTLASLLLTLLATTNVAGEAGRDGTPDPWAAAVNSGDASAVSAFYASDAVLITPALEIITSADGIAGYLLSDEGVAIRHLEVAPVDSRQEGDTLYQSSVWVATVTRQGLESTIDGALNNVYTRQPDGSWKISLQNWN